MDCVGEIASLPYLRVTFAKEEMETGAQNRKEGRKEGRGRRKKEVGTTNLRPVGLLSVCLCRSSLSIVSRRTNGNTGGIRYIRIRGYLCDDAWKIAWQTILRFSVFDKRVYHNEGRSPRRKLRKGGLRGCAWSPAERLHAFLLVNRETGLRSRWGKLSRELPNAHGHHMFPYKSARLCLPLYVGRVSEIPYHLYYGNIVSSSR